MLRAMKAAAIVALCLVAAVTQVEGSLLVERLRSRQQRLGSLHQALDTDALTGSDFLGRHGAPGATPPAADADGAMALAEISSSTHAGEAFNTCKNCVYVLERIKQGYQYLLPSICVEIYSKATDSPETQYATCHQVLAALSVWGHNVRHWFHFGCYKSETYGAMELVKPCPSHVICAQMADFKKTPFCAKPPPDALNPGTAVATTL